MQIQSNSKLFDTLVRALPLSFLEDMAQSYPAICAEALAEASSSPLIGETEARYVVPHLRRAMFETQFRSKGIDSGLVALVKATKNDTANFSMVKAGPFVLTASYVASPGSFVRPAVFRAETATVNELLDQGDFFGYPGAGSDSAKEIASDAIYCILLYGSSKTATGNSTFMEFAFPHPELPKYVDHYSFNDVLMSSRALVASPEVGQADGAFPTPKPIKKDGTTGEV